jgi:O-antigen/teichoic acid export membrane protein
VVAAVSLAALLAVSQTSLAAYVYGAKFARQALAKILLAGATALVQLIAVWAGYGIEGMIYGQVLAVACVVTWIVIDVCRCFSVDLGGASMARYFSTIREHWRFPVFSMPADFISALSAQLPLFLIGGRFGGSLVGQYALTNRTLAAPVGLLAGSVLSVFKEEASRQYRETGQCRQAYIKTFRSLAVLGVAPFTLLFFISERLFVLVFGPDWAEAGRLAAMLVPMFYLKFVASPLSYTMYLASRQSYDLLWQIALLVMTASVFKFSSDIQWAVMSYSIGYSVLYLAYLRMSYLSARGVNR